MQLITPASFMALNPLLYNFVPKSYQVLIPNKETKTLATIAIIKTQSPIM
tara:strand:+ start:149 stop:298 length:150 start_codon:yes stop_codon:yes gene_type:complete